MKIKLRWCLKSDLFTHKENNYNDKSFNEFYSFISYWLTHRLSEFKCIHIYVGDEDCEEDLVFGHHEPRPRCMDIKIME